MNNSSNPFGGAGDPFGDPFGEESHVETYQPPQIGPGAWSRAPVDDDINDDDGYAEPFSAAHLAASHGGSVPAVAAVPGVQAPLQFAESSVPAQATTGRMGSSLPPLLSSPPPEAVLLTPPGGPTSAPYDGGASGYEDWSSYPLYSIKRYRWLFNVDTNEVLQRLFRAVALFFRTDFLVRVDANPDVYGPFWVAATLVFVTAVTGNVASYVDWLRAHGQDPAQKQAWYGSVDKVGASVGLFYGYIFGVGLALFLAFKYLKVAVGLAALWCCYGYALAAYVPVAFLCVLPVEPLRWAALGAATASSGSFILLNLRGRVVEAAGPRAVPVFIALAALHAALGLGLKLYFFKFVGIPL